MYFSVFLRSAFIPRLVKRKACTTDFVSYHCRFSPNNWLCVCVCVCDVMWIMSRPEKKSMSWKCSHLKWGCFCFHSNNQFPIIHHVVCSTHSPPCRMLVVATSWKSFIYYVCHDKTAGTKNYWFFAPGSFLQIQDDMKFHEGEKRAENGTREMSLAYGGHILMHEIPMINISASIPVPVWLKLISVGSQTKWTSYCWLSANFYELVAARSL